MELRVLAVVMHLVAMVALVAATWMSGTERVAACLLVIVAGGAAAQLVWRHHHAPRW